MFKQLFLFLNRAWSKIKKFLEELDDNEEN